MTNENKKIKKFMLLLKSELKSQNLTITTFAKMMEVSRRQIYRWINDEQKIPLEKYYRVLEILNLKEKITKSN